MTEKQFKAYDSTPQSKKDKRIFLEIKSQEKGKPFNDTKHKLYDDNSSSVIESMRG